MKLLRIIGKNLKVLFRSRTTVFVLLLAPIIIVLLLALTFHNASAYKVTVATYSKSYSSVSNSFLEKLGKENTVRKALSEDLCITAVKLDLTSVCVVFPENLKVEQGKKNTIAIYVDPSKANLAWQVANSLSASINTEKSEISTDLTNQVLKVMSVADKMLVDNMDEVSSLKNTTSELQQNLIEINAGIKNMDLNFNPKLFMQAELEKDADSILEELKNAETGIDKAAAKVKSSSAQNNEKDQIDQYLNQAKASLSAAQNKTESPGLKADIAALSKNVEETAKRIDAAYYQRDLVLKIMEKMQPKFNQSMEDITMVEAVFNDAHFALNNMRISDASTIANPIDTEIKTIVSGKTHLGYVFATVLAIIVMVVSLLLSSSLVIKEERSKSFLMNYMTPVGDFWFVIAMYLSLLVVVGIQLTILLGIIGWLFESSIMANLVSVSLVVFVCVSFFILLGMLIGYMFKSEYSVTLVSVSLALLFLLISDMLLPLQSAPKIMQEYISYNPFMLSQNLFKQTILFGHQLPRVAIELGIVGIASLVLFIIILFTEKVIKRHGFEKLLKRFRK